MSTAIKKREAPSPPLRELARKRHLVPFVKGVTSATKEGDSPRAMVVAYIDARATAIILDRIVGPANWAFQLLSAPLVKQGNDWIAHGRLTIRLDDGREVYREDIGAGDGDVETGGKGASSDAFKRCAVMFGVGRALYYLPQEWVPAEVKGRGKPQPTPEGMKQAIQKWRGLLDRPDADAPSVADALAAERAGDEAFAEDEDFAQALARGYANEEDE